MIVLAGEKRRPAGRTQRADDEGVAEPEAFRGDAVHVGRGPAHPGEAPTIAQSALDDADGIPALIVGQHDDDVGAPRRLRAAVRGEDQDGEQADA
jgi:hypothetical protein